MRKITFLFLLIFCFAFAGTAFAAEKLIGVFNMQEVAMKSDAYKEATKKLESTFTGEKTDLEKQQNSLNKMAEDLKAQGKGLSPEALEEKQVEYMRKKRDFDDKTRLFLRRVETEERRLQQDIASVIVQATQSYGKRNNFALLMDAANAGVIHADPSMDVTDDILAETNKVWKENPPKPKK